jgi:Zn-dependent protease
METEIIFAIAILVMSVVIHEVAHGYAALWLGDVTAKYAGRLTLNPIKHIDPFGSIIIPLLMAILPGNLIFGWAKPVPYNPYNLKNQRWGELIVAAAGPLSNIIIAIVFGLLIRFAPLLDLPSAFIQISLTVVFINLVLAVFNLIPIAPLDGSKILYSLLPEDKARAFMDFTNRYSIFLLVFFIFVLWQFVIYIVFLLAKLITGLPIF